MRPIAQKHRKVIDQDPAFKRCIRHAEGGCQGRITIEHAFIYGGRQIDELWNFVPLCAFHHAIDQFLDGGDYQREVGQLWALSRASPEDLAKYPKRDWAQEERRLINLII